MRGKNDQFVGSWGYIDGVQGALYPEELAVWFLGVFIATRWGGWGWGGWGGNCRTGDWVIIEDDL